MVNKSFYEKAPGGFGSVFYDPEEEKHHWYVRKSGTDKGVILSFTNENGLEFIWSGQIDFSPSFERVADLNFLDLFHALETIRTGETNDN